MDLNNVERFRELDPEGMIDRINGLPDQLAGAYQLGLEHDLPAWEGIEKVLVAGMGSTRSSTAPVQFSSRPSQTSGAPG